MHAKKVAADLKKRIANGRSSKREGGYTVTQEAAEASMVSKGYKAPTTALNANSSGSSSSSSSSGSSGSNISSNNTSNAVLIPHPVGWENQVAVASVSPELSASSILNAHGDNARSSSQQASAAASPSAQHSFANARTF